MARLFCDLFERADRAAGLRATQVEVIAGGGAVYAVRDSADLILGCVTGTSTLPSLMFYDLKSVLAEIERGSQ